MAVIDLLPSILLGAAPLALVWIVVWLRRSPLPPGPRSEWKNRVKPGTQPWKAYKELAKEYGPIMCTQASFGAYAFVVDTAETLVELFEKRSKIFSCRPRWVMAELYGRQNNVGLMYYGEELTRVRKVLHRGIGLQAVPQWENLFEYESLKILSDALADSANLLSSVEYNIESMVVRFTYGHDMDDEFLKLATKVSQQTGVALQPGRWMVNYIPILAYVPAWFPGAGFQKLAREGKDYYFKLTRPPYERVKEELSRGVATPSFVSHSLTDMAKHPHLGFNEQAIMSAAGSVFSAAVDTTTSTVLSFFLLAATHPEVQERAYNEIMAVVGPDRLPALQDQDSLPYINCIMKEIWRFNPPVPILTHSPIAEDKYLGYRIPKKSWVFGNVWSIMHNEAQFPEPDKFNPDRFLPVEGQPMPPDPKDFVFGLGRRLCPGMNFANALVFLTISRAIALSEIRPPRGETLLLEFTTSLISRPKPFKCVVTPRKGVPPELLAQLKPEKLKALYKTI
ncbi:cytochrome P450 [Pluteus cervinus]|uniref:Cytochrome P450 n=1 Tax=Pluteus cervinus TaxID=181527 RepID=A0ACD3AR31_9AGAR|nr:cytochrome P450 [Pluteus cervinus]